MSHQKAMRFEVTYDDGRVETVVAGAADYVAMERKYGVGFGALADPQTARIEYLLFLAWRGSRRGHPEVPDFDEWMEQLDGLPVTDDEKSGGEGEGKAPAST